MRHMSKIKFFMFMLAAVFFATCAFGAEPATIKIGDTISVWVKGESDLSVERVVSKDGSITYPLIGSVGVSGLKCSAAARLIGEMLEDGFLRKAVVEVKIEPKSELPTQNPLQAGVSAFPPEKVKPTKTLELIEIVDSENGKGVGGAILNMGNKIYKSNGLGQILLDSTAGHAVILADGYKSFSGELSYVLSKDGKKQVKLEAVTFPESVTFMVADAVTRKPIPNVEVILSGCKVKTNKKGEFKISQIKKEFGEITLKCRGYKTSQLVVDYKDTETQTLFMLPDE